MSPAPLSLAPLLVGVLLGTLFLSLALLSLAFAAQELFQIALALRSPSRRELSLPAGSARSRAPDTSTWSAGAPSVCVQLPLYNEASQVAGLLRAVVALDYPPTRLTIQVLDDSTDETRERVDAFVQAHAQRCPNGPQIEVLRRPTRAGFKAGALAAGLARTDAELIAVFDADFRPAPDFLQRTVLKCAAWQDPQLAFVQARWTFPHADTWFARVQKLLLERHFVLFKPVRQETQRVMFFNGSGGVWRRRAIHQVGGWHSDTLCEDLDLSYRAAAAGLRGQYLPEVEIANALPPDLHAFRTQQHRWARGSAQCLRKLLPTLWRLPGGGLRRLDETLVVAGYLIHPLMFALLLIWPWAVLYVPPQIFWPAQALAGLATLVSPAGFTLAALRAGRQADLRLLGDILLALLLGFGLLTINTQAVLRGLFSRRAGVFERTPKRAGLAPRRRGTAVLEALLLAYSLGSGLYLAQAGQWMWVPPTLFWSLCLGLSLVLQALPSLATVMPPWLAQQADA